MKVVMVGATFPPDFVGGTEQVMVALGRALQQAGHEVAVLCSSERTGRGGEIVEEQFAGMRVFRHYRHADEWEAGGIRRPRLLAAVRQRLVDLRPDVLHVHHLGAFGAGLIAQARADGVPAVLTFHDLWTTCPRYFRVPPTGIVCPTGSARDSCVPCVQEMLPGERAARIEAGLAERDRELRAEVDAALCCTAPSRAAAARIAGHLPFAGDIAVVPHGLLGAVPAAARAAAPRPGERLRVGTFGNLVAEKGVADLVAAMAGLPAELHLHGRFLVPQFEAELRELARARGVDLHVHGPFAADDRHPAQDLHLCVFPSRCQETYGLVVDEALARGVPVVLSDQGAFAERQGPGVLAAPLAQLPAVLRGLLTTPAGLATLRAAVPASLPTIDAAASTYLDLYRGAIAALRRP